MSTWLMEGPYLKTCNCDPGCPCDFNQAPTHGHCHGCGAMQIERGHYGDVSLDGLRWVFVASWPGRMDEGDGQMQIIVDERAGDDQFHALTTILSGAAGDILYEILDAVCPHKHEPLRAPIDFDWDIERRSASVRAGDVFETSSETLRGIDPPVPYRARVQISGGFEYTSADESAEVALATVLRSSAGISMDVRDGNANLAYVRHEGAVPAEAELAGTTA